MVVSRSAAGHAAVVQPTIVGAAFALAAFAVAIIAGIFASNEALTVLGRATLALLVCYPAGYIVGIVCHRVVEAELQAKSASDSIDGSGDPTSTADDTDDRPPTTDRT